MTLVLEKEQVVRIIAEKGKAGLFYATSPDLKGLLVAERNMDALNKNIPSAVANLYLARGRQVVVKRADNDPGYHSAWVAEPA
ncbi:MAG: hypothetical protein QOF14_3723 [Hyphomicrobiales bacterium]|jgi:hypothetical protein|nr:hypothetical protein [Hyphomicrobiales bacterium]